MNKDYVNPMIGTLQQVLIIGPLILHIKTLLKESFNPTLCLKLSHD